MSNLRETPK